jgi:hypothetical protein
MVAKVKSLSSVSASQNKVVVLKTKNTRDSRKARRQREGATTKYQQETEKNVKMTEQNLVFVKPLWLETLYLLQVGSSVFSFFLVGAMLFMYGMTVYAPYKWTEEYRRLKELQKDERQITAANEMIKNQLAKQAQTQGVGLVDPDPTARPIILPVTPTQPLKQNQDETPKIKAPQVSGPLAY